jgi:Big-like domain-containing protein
VTFRAGERVSLGTRPSFVVVGPRAGDFASVRIKREGGEVLQASLEDGKFRWPSTAPPLESGTTYELLFLARRADERAASVDFVAVRQTASEELVLLSVD